MAADSDESSASNSYSQSDTSSIDNSVPMKKTISPKPSPRTPSSSSTPQERKFNNLFAKAGLDSENESSHPSGARTSVSSQSNGRSPIQRRNSARSSRSSHSGSDSEARSALSPTSSSNRSDGHDNSAGSASHSDRGSVPASHGSSWHSSNSRSRRSTGTNSENSAPSHESSHTHGGHSSYSRSQPSSRESASSASPGSNDMESKQHDDSETGSASRQGRSNQGSRSSQSDMGSPTASNADERFTDRSQEPMFPTEQQGNQSNPQSNTSDRTPVEAQSHQAHENEPNAHADHSVTSPKINPESGLHLPTESNPNESEGEKNTAVEGAPVEAMHSVPNEAPILKPLVAPVQEEEAKPIEETIKDDVATSDQKAPGDTATKLARSTRSEAPPENYVRRPKGAPMTPRHKIQNLQLPDQASYRDLKNVDVLWRAQSDATREGSNPVVASKTIESKSNDSPPKSDDIAGEASVQVGNDLKKLHVKTLPQPIVDEHSSKLDSQSDYDPRRDDTEKWKDLIRRSAQGSSEQRSSGGFRRGKSGQYRRKG